MDVRIGVTYTAKELDVELADDADTEKLKTDIQAALGKGEMVWMTDKRGRQVGVPADKVAYIEFGRPDADHRIGFSG
ncbi:MAG: DUF3107 domain-containing protein [Actinomycetota bacterium]|nr:DUF3107 domain-containing protein [Actinomycetota bacterium]